MSILFVCLGNICRSPMAEVVMNKVAANHGCTDLRIDSAGLIAYHQGEMADRRMQQQAYARGYRLMHRSRPVAYDDFFDFDYIIGMDDKNIESLKAQSPTLDCERKILRMADFIADDRVDYVPDPYYGGVRGFDFVIDLLEEGCENLYKWIVEDFV